MRILLVVDRFIRVTEELQRRLPNDELVVSTPAEAPTADVLIPLTAEVDAELMDRVRPLLIQQFGVGIEKIDVAAAKARGITVANVPADISGSSEAVAEIAIFHLISVSRCMADAGRAMAAGQTNDAIGRGLRGMRVAILGLGSIGTATALRLRPFGVELVGIGSRSASEVEGGRQVPGVTEYRSSQDMPEALDGLDALVICCPLTEHTRHMIGSAEIAAMNPGSLLVNVARGPIVRYSALLTALQDGQLGGVGLDVFWDGPLLPNDPILAHNVSVTPHIGGSSLSAYEGMADHVVRNIEALRGGEPIGSSAE